MQYDLIIIGGGVNGCGIARDAAMRGLKCLLLERNDFGAETTGASSKMIHGGLRYLLYDRKTTKLSSQDSGVIQKIASHLLFRIPFLFPVPAKKGWEGFTRKLYFELLETFFGVYDKYAPLKNSKPHTRLSREEALELEPDLNPNIVGAVSIDEWGIDTNRLCIHNVLDAELHGAVVCNHQEVSSLIQEEGRVVGVRTRDTLTGESFEHRGAITVNTTGPWADHLAQMASCRVPLRPAKGVHLSFDRRISNYGIITRALDHRMIFFMPYQNISFIGTTDDDYFGDPGDIPILEDEVEYLLEGVERVFPRIREFRRTHAWAGVRPTLYRRGPYEDDLSRDHKIFDHEATEGVAGFVSLAGGKLASYRLMSEELTDWVVKKLGKGTECRTHLEPLPGGEAEVQAKDLVEQYAVSTFAAQRLIYRYGTRAHEVLKLIGEHKAYANEICACDPVLEAELRFVIRQEHARTLGDLQRRTRLSLGPCQGLRCWMGAAHILSEELSLKPSQVLSQVKTEMQQRWQEKRPILAGVGWQQEELMAQNFMGMGGLDKVS